jgi:hypothetical protein
VLFGLGLTMVRVWIVAQAHEENEKRRRPK